MATIAMVGVGAIGSVTAALLEAAGHEVLLCVRRPLPGLTVEREGRTVSVKGRRLLDPAALPRVDWLFVATKAYDVPAAAVWLMSPAARGAPVAVLQNGVEHRERLAPFVPADRVVPVVVECPVERPEPGRVRQRGRMMLKVGDDALGRAFAALFAGSETGVTALPDFRTAAWRKLCLNAAGVINALLLRPTIVFRDEAIAEAARQLVREAVAVGRAEGAELEEGIPEAVIQTLLSQPPDSINSLHADRAAGRPTEIDARNGAIVRIGRRHGIPTPANQLAVALLSGGG